MKRRTLFVALPILTVIATAMALWWLSPHIIERLARGVLAGHGLDDVMVEVSPPRFDGVRVHRLGFSAADGSVKVMVEDVRVSFRAMELFSSVVRSVSVARVDIVLGGERESASPLVLPAVLPEIDTGWISLLPVQGVDIARIALLRADETPLSPPFSLSINTAMENSALIIARPLAAGELDRVVEVVMDGDGRISGAFAYDDPLQQPALEFGMLLSTDEGRWAAELSTEASRLNTWLEPLSAQPLPLSTCGVMARLRVGENPLETVAIGAQLSDCQLPEVSLRGAELNAVFMRTANGLASATPARVRVDGVVTPMAAARELVSVIGVDIDLDSGIVTLPSGARFSATGVVADDLTIERLDATLAETLPLSMHQPAGVARVDVRNTTIRWHDNLLAAGEARLEVPFDDTGISLRSARTEQATIDAADLRVRLSPVTVNIVDAVATIEVAEALGDYQGNTFSASAIRANMPLSGERSATLEAVIPALAVTMDDFGAWLSQGVVGLDWRSGVVDGKFSALLADAMSLEGTIRLEDDTGVVELAGVPMALGDRPRRASDLISGWPDGVDLLTGYLGFSAKANWDAAGTAAWATIHLDNVGGVVDDIYFSNATTQIELELYPQLRTLSPATVTVGVVDYGLSLTGASASLELGAASNGVPAVVATDIRAELFGGVVRIARFDSASSNGFELLLEEIDLAEVVGDDSFPGLTMSGRITGAVPVEIRADGLYISDGALQNSVDGVLHYDAGDVAEGSGAEILFNALKTFEYTVLRVEPEFRPDGTLILMVHMQGTSEEIGRNQPIHFNINVEQNLLSLLESVRLVNGLNDHIDRGVQQFYERQNP